MPDELDIEIGITEEGDMEHINPDYKTMIILQIVNLAGKQMSYDEALKKIREVDKEYSQKVIKQYE